MTTFLGLTKAQIEKRLNEGRGRGRLAGYKPFITVRDISSRGRVHRPFGLKSKRIHHLLSDLELAIFLTLDWSEVVTDIREQFPLNLDDTSQIADQASVRHAEFKGVLQIMTSDFLVDTLEAARPQVAIQAKYAKDLEDERTVEKLELERRYWLSKGIPWYLVTEKDVSAAAVQNIKWLSAVTNDEVEEDDIHRHFELFIRLAKVHPQYKLPSLAQQLDLAYDLTPGDGLYWLRVLMSRRYFLFDITQTYQDLLASDLVINTEASRMEVGLATG